MEEKMKHLLIGILLLACAGVVTASDITYVDFAKTQIVAMRIADYTKMGEGFDKLGGWAGPKGLFDADTRFIGMYSGDLSNPEKMLCDVALSIKGTVEPPAGARVESLEGKYAMLAHFGPYEKLPETWSKLMKNIQESKEYKIASKPCFEFYLNDPSKVKQDALITEIYIPIEPVK
jgi:AraC family transcriptional regulator